ncbi:MAG: hypothetical protein H7066_20800 [Cytophagaceae bacterium]|nr:hypothetical protein [Gemmatimonadaceae bacterium]
MSNQSNKPRPSERWLLTCVLAIIPLALAIVLPVAFRIPLFIVAALLVGWGLVQMSRQPPTDLRGE